MISQSNTIARYEVLQCFYIHDLCIIKQTFFRFLAKRFDLAGSNDIEAAKVDMINDQLADLQSYFRQANYEQPDEESKKAALEKFNSGKLVHFFQTLETLLTNWGGEFAVGTAFTFADFNIALFCDRFIDNLGGNLDQFPRLSAIREKVNTNEKIAAWRQSRPDTPF